VRDRRGRRASTSTNSAYPAKNSGITIALISKNSFKSCRQARKLTP